MQVSLVSSLSSLCEYSYPFINLQLTLSSNIISGISRREVGNRVGKKRSSGKY